MWQACRMLLHCLVLVDRNQAWQCLPSSSLVFSHPSQLLQSQIKFQHHILGFNLGRLLPRESNFGIVKNCAYEQRDYAGIPWVIRTKGKSSYRRSKLQELLPAQSTGWRISRAMWIIFWPSALVAPLGGRPRQVQPRWQLGLELFQTYHHPFEVQVDINEYLL